MNRKRKLKDVYCAGLRVGAAALALRYGVAAAQARLGTVTRKFVRYWREKVRDPSFHPGTHGGSRNFIRSHVDRRWIEMHVWGLMKQDPLRSAAQYVAELEAVGVRVNTRWIQRLVKRWGLTWKKAMHKQIHKFTVSNILYYARFVVGIRQFPMYRLKYCDESHFESRALRRARGLAEMGRELVVASDNSIRETYSITLLTTLQDTEMPLVLSNFRVGSNSAEDFLRWVQDLIADRHLTAGDVLVCDNASVHKAADIAVPLSEALDAANVRMYFLPTYSPELNPCELVFSQTKSILRRRRGSKSFWLEIVDAFAQVTFENVYNYYVKCLSV